MANFISFHTAQEPKLEVSVNLDLVRAIFPAEETRSCTLVFDKEYAISVSGSLKDVESKLKGGATSSVFKR
jgi:hypothetical protein